MHSVGSAHAPARPLGGGGARIERNDSPRYRAKASVLLPCFRVHQVIQPSGCALSTGAALESNLAVVKVYTDIANREESSSNCECCHKLLNLS